MDVKQKLYDQCLTYLDGRVATLMRFIESQRSSLEAETKSSAGDKHETGRAMIQLEMEKASQQIESLRLMRETMNKINIKGQDQIASAGSLVYTSNGNYFLSISAGLLKVKSVDSSFDEEEYYAVSVSSPIGQLLLGKMPGDSMVFKSQKIQIMKIN